MSTRLILSVLGGALAGMALMFVLRRPWKRLVARYGRPRVATAGILIALSGLFYSVPHEFGHYAAARALGGTVTGVTWTIFSGEEPHVEYGHPFPPEAVPWASAWGILLPTALALLLAGVWIGIGYRLHWLPSQCILVPAIVFLFSNFGLAIEAMGSGSHMSQLPRRLGLGAPGVILFHAIPPLLSLGAFAAIRWRVVRERRRETASDGGPGPPPS